MQCTQCRQETEFKPTVAIPGLGFVVSMRSHADAEQWAWFCAQCDKVFCGVCCLPGWQALKAKEGLSSDELAAKLNRDPLAYYGEQARCPQCQQKVMSQMPKATYNTVQAISDTIEDAVARAEKRLPPKAIIESQQVTPPSHVVKTIDAFEEREAFWKAFTAANPGVRIVDIELRSVGKKGFLGVGKKPNLYQFKEIHPASVNIRYKVYL